MKHIPGTKYISQHNHGYLIQRYNPSIQKMEYYYSSVSLISVLMVRDLLIAGNWDKSVIPYETIAGEKYIYKDHNGFSVRKAIDGKLIHFGYFENIEDAIIERDLLVKGDWDFDTLCNSPIENEQWLTGKYGKNQFQTRKTGRIDIRTW